MAFGDYQNEIYFGGLMRGVKPTLPVDFRALEARARAALPPSTLTYVQGGCGDEFTQDHNAEAFKRWGIIPRMMVDCTTRDLSIDFGGSTTAISHRTDIYTGTGAAYTGFAWSQSTDYAATAAVAIGLA